MNFEFGFTIPLTFKISVKHSSDDDPITQETVEKCIRIAMDAHEGQRDRDGNAVILHPLMVGSMGKTDAEKCVGFLHDAIEDTELDFIDLEMEGLPDEIIDALKLLTHDEGTDYYEYVQRIIDSGNQTAINVKYNDLTHDCVYNAKGLRLYYKRASFTVQKDFVYKRKLLMVSNQRIDL